jgi:hypothetical protein
MQFGIKWILMVRLFRAIPGPLPALIIMRPWSMWRVSSWWWIFPPAINHYKDDKALLHDYIIFNNVLSGKNHSDKLFSE